MLRNEESGLVDIGPIDVPDQPLGFADWVTPHLAVLRMLAVREVGAADADDVVLDCLVRA